MKRKIFTLCTLFSLLLGAATGLWWMRSSAKVDQLSLERAGRDTLKVWGTDGKVLFTRTGLPPAVTVKKSRSETPAPAVVLPEAQLRWASYAKGMVGSPAADPKFTMTSFSFASTPAASATGTAAESTFVVPAWMITTVFGFLPLLWIATRFKKQRKAKEEA